MTDFTPGRKRRGPLRRLLDLLDERLSAPIDAEARAKGHTVHRRPGTRTHVYHDSRWTERRLAMLNNPDGEPDTPDRGVEMVSGP